jgi:8-oxo-dGTP pyrophosphatase MutT (NUDIX family)
VIRSGKEVLLVRQSYAPGWQFPGGGVDRSEHLADALERELLEETGIALQGAPRLHGIFSNFREFKGDRIVAIGLTTAWRPQIKRRQRTSRLFARSDFPRPHPELIDIPFADDHLDRGYRFLTATNPLGVELPLQ